MDVKTKINEIFERYGIDSEGENAELDSFAFISMVIEIENEFELELPDEFMNFFSFDTKRITNYLMSVCDKDSI